MADLFDIVVARKLSGGGGGGGTTVEALSVTQNGTYTAPSGKAYSPVTVNVSGGSSDFSTAEVTVSLSSFGQIVYLPNTYDEEGYEAVLSDIQENGTYNVVLYKGCCVGALRIAGAQASATGNIEIDGSEVIITGDGTITIS